MTYHLHGNDLAGRSSVHHCRSARRKTIVACGQIQRSVRRIETLLRDFGDESSETRNGAGVGESDKDDSSPSYVTSRGPLQPCTPPSAKQGSVGGGAFGGQQ